MIRDSALTKTDLLEIATCRGEPQRLGFAYQLGFVQVFQRFPVKQPARAAKSRAAPDFPFDPDLLPHVSPIEWNNVILYGEIKIDPAKLKLRVPWRLFLHESGRHPTLQQWGGSDAAFKRMNELKRQLSPKEAVPKEAATATVTSPIDSHSIWHSTRLTGIDFEGLNWGQSDPPGAKTSCDRLSPDSEGGLSQI